MEEEFIDGSVAAGEDQVEGFLGFGNNVSAQRYELILQ